MVRERKCILCHIVYSSKKEMDNHMRSMLHHRELENLKGRDCSHECRVCRVTVVGLSTYAKHISSQLHKDNVDALDKEEEKEEAEEEYFDKELVQLINQRKEQSRQEEARRLSKQQETDRYQRIRDDRVTFENMGLQDWKHRDSSERNWQWQNECFTNPRQGNFPQPFLNLNPNRHLTGPRGRAGWHLNGPMNHHMISGNSGGSWHSNAGGPTSWHHRGTGRNLHWYPDGNGSFSNSHPINCGVNWQTNPYGANQWNFSGAAEPFPQGRNRPLWNCDSTQENEPGWNNCTSNNFVKERFTWKKTTGNNNKAKPNSNKKKSEKKEDFTSDILPEDNLFEKSDKSNKTKSAPCPVKNNSLPRDKPYRWTPYPSQKVSETQETLPKNVETDISIQSAEARNEDEKTENAENLPKPEWEED
ncbi:zinc finger protein 106-like [Rhinophrynus dorsalis]